MSKYSDIYCIMALIIKRIIDSDKDSTLFNVYQNHKNDVEAVEKVKSLPYDKLKVVIIQQVQGDNTNHD